VRRKGREGKGVPKIGLIRSIRTSGQIKRGERKKRGEKKECGPSSGSRAPRPGLRRGGERLAAFFDRWRQEGKKGKKKGRDGDGDDVPVALEEQREERAVHR